jgi:hypothetical protein
LDSGFRFLYPDIDTALAAITGRRPAKARQSVHRPALQTRSHA